MNYHKLSTIYSNFALPRYIEPYRMKTNIHFQMDIYVQRRAALSANIQSGKILLLGNGHSPINFRDNYYPFRQDSSFLYFIGINLPYVHALIDIEADKVILYGDDVTMDDIIWVGDQRPLKEVAQATGI